MTNVSCPQSGLRTIRDCAKPKNSNFPDFFVRYNVCNYKKQFHKNPLRNVGEVAGQTSYFGTYTQQHGQRLEIYIIMVLEKNRSVVLNLFGKLPFLMYLKT